MSDQSKRAVARAVGQAMAAVLRGRPKIRLCVPPGWGAAFSNVFRELHLDKIVIVVVDPKMPADTFALDDSRWQPWFDRLGRAIADAQAVVSGLIRHGGPSLPWETARPLKTPRKGGRG